MRKFLQPTAAWRISIWTAVAFAVGTALAFSIVYFLVAKAIQERSDAWLSGEAEVLARVSIDTPKDHLYNRIVREVAELATQELPDERNARGQRLNSVFFLQIDPNNNENPLWVGPGSNDAFLTAIQRTKVVADIPQSLNVEGWPMAFRVVSRNENGRMIYLGLSTRGARNLLSTLTRRFLLLWGATVLMGFLISYLRVHRLLASAERELPAARGRKMGRSLRFLADRRKRRCLPTRHSRVLGRKFGIFHRSARGERNRLTGWRSAVNSNSQDPSKGN